jgi:hypothetical protein
MDIDILKLNLSRNKGKNYAKKKEKFNEKGSLERTAEAKVQTVVVIASGEEITLKLISNSKTCSVHLLFP